MITHKNHQFIYNDIASLELPNGMCIHYDCGVTPDNDFHFIAPDRSVRLVIEFFTSTKSAKELIEELNERDGYEVLCPPSEITTPAGVNGYSITYATRREHYEEWTLDLGGEERCNFWLMYKRNMPCDEALYEQVKCEMLDNIKII